MTKGMLRALVLISVVVAGSKGFVDDAYAQSAATVGSVRGTLRDSRSHEAVAGATVVATSPSLQGEQVTLTDETGQYYLTSLPPGLYTLTIYYVDAVFTRSNVLVQLGKDVVVNVGLETTKVGKRPKGEVIELSGTAPIVDQGSTKIGVTITEDFTRNVPTNRTFGGVVGQAAGAQTDNFGTSFAGATSGENVYIVEGINTTDTGFGGLWSARPDEVILEA